MRSTSRTILAATVVAGLLALPVAGAGAEDQVLTGTVGGTVSISSAPADATLTLPTPATGQDIGDIVVAANTSYTLAVQADNDRMTQYAAGAYSTDPDATLDAALLLTAVNAAPTTGGMGFAAVPATTLPLTLATNPLSGLLSTTDTFGVAATQTTTALDPAGTYRMVVTYSVSAGLPIS